MAPVDTVQLGCVTLAIVGIAGAIGTALITTLPLEAEVQVPLLTIKV